VEHYTVETSRWSLGRADIFSLRSHPGRRRARGDGHFLVGGSCLAVVGIGAFPSAPAPGRGRV